MTETTRKHRLPLIKGVEVELGGELLTIPPLNFRHLEQYADTLVSISTGSADNPYKNLRYAVPVILAALQRNYPDITEDEVSEIVDMGNYHKVLESVMGISGINEEILAKYKVVSPGE